MSEPKEMDPEDLKSMKSQLALPRCESELEERDLRNWIDVTISDRDFQVRAKDTAQAASEQRTADWKTALGERDRWRRIARRHPPTEEDAAHITRTQVKAWEERSMVSTHDEDDDSFADRATWLANKVGRDPWDVLAEMAALTEVKS